jgi:hypothetical protein
MGCPADGRVGLAFGDRGTTLLLCRAQLHRPSADETSTTTGHHADSAEREQLAHWAPFSVEPTTPGQLAAWRADGGAASANEKAG